MAAGGAVMAAARAAGGLRRRSCGPFSGLIRARRRVPVGGCGRAPRGHAPAGAAPC